uniref:Uncharacterized protein n=1 Tax=Anguilla anguilla TaxID=7936 RepID=A0A0E9V747_ANGAN
MHQRSLLCLICVFVFRDDRVS